MARAVAAFGGCLPMLTPEPSHRGRNPLFQPPAVAAAGIGRLPLDLAVEVCRHLQLHDLAALACVSRFWRRAVREPGVWAALVHRSYEEDDLPQDLSLLESRATTSNELRDWLRTLRLQRPAFKSLVQRHYDLEQDTGAVYRQVLVIDGRRDLNYSTVYANLQPGHYRVVWRIRLQPGFTRGYINFKALFALSKDKKRAPDAAATATAASIAVSGLRRLPSAALGAAVGADEPAAAAAAGAANSTGGGRASRIRAALGRAIHPFRRRVQPAQDAAAPAAGLHAQQQLQPQLPQQHAPLLLARQPSVGRRSIKPEEPKGPHFLPACLAVLLGTYSSSWKQVDGEGPELGGGEWRRVQAGTLTVRRACDVHLQNVVVQMRGRQEQLQPPPPGASPRSVVVDYVELLPVVPRGSGGAGAGAGALEGLRRSRRGGRGGPTVEADDVLVLPKL